jgi:hypothetical protein
MAGGGPFQYCSPRSFLLFDAGTLRVLGGRGGFPAGCASKADSTDVVKSLEQLNVLGRGKGWRFFESEVAMLFAD